MYLYKMYMYICMYIYMHANHFLLWVKISAASMPLFIYSSLNIPFSLQDNEYVRAIKAVGSVLAPYDSDQLIPAYGFGARMPDGQVSHCFPLNFNPQRPDVYGVQVCTCYMYIT